MGVLPVAHSVCVNPSRLSSFTCPRGGSPELVCGACPLLLSRLGAGIRTAEDRARSGVLFFGKETKKLEGRRAFLCAQAVLTELLTELGHLAHRGAPTREANGGESPHHTARRRAGAAALRHLAEDGLVVRPSSGLAQRRTKPRATTTPNDQQTAPHLPPLPYTRFRPQDLEAGLRPRL
jgi:hypothetical protein